MSKPRYYRYKAEILTKKKLINVYKLILQGNNIKYLKTIERHFMFAKTIDIDIPLEEYEVTRNHSDFTAFQSDDRFWSTTETHKRPNLEICRNLIKEALSGYNTEPILIIDNNEKT